MKEKNTNTNSANTNRKSPLPICDRDEAEFWKDFDWRVGKLTQTPTHFLGTGHPVPIFNPLPKKPEKK